ncbi:MAG: hypothetical protein L3J67_03375 [Hyphomicrobiaceae bacterium]|nr:hypothetical protein [Hyphomicrobiaceae bacterium]
MSQRLYAKIVPKRITDYPHDLNMTGRYPQHIVPHCRPTHNDLCIEKESAYSGFISSERTGFDFVLSNTDEKGCYLAETMNLSPQIQTFQPDERCSAEVMRRRSTRCCRVVVYRSVAGVKVALFPLPLRMISEVVVNVKSSEVVMCAGHRLNEYR